MLIVLAGVVVALVHAEAQRQRYGAALFRPGHQFSASRRRRSASATAAASSGSSCAARIMEPPTSLISPPLFVSSMQSEIGVVPPSRTSPGASRRAAVTTSGPSRQAPGIRLVEPKHRVAAGIERADEVQEPARVPHLALVEVACCWLGGHLRGLTVEKPGTLRLDAVEVPKAAERKSPAEAEATYVECVKFDRCIDYKGGRPYKDWKHHGPGFDFMDGYKYGPISALAYFPLTHSYRERGIFSVNFAFWVLHGLMMWGLARAAFPSQRAAPWRALIGWLAPLILPLWATLPTLNVEALGHSYELAPPERGTFILEITRRCANDIIPVTLGLAALLMAARKHWLFSGVCLGLSLAAKPLPALLWCVLLPGFAGNKARPLIISAVLTTVVCYLPFFAWAPREMIANLIAFSWLRPTNASSIRAYIPESLGGLIGALQLLSCVALTFAFYRSGPRDLGRLLRTSALSTIAFVAFNKVVHGNYLLWIQPLAALTLAGLPFRAPARASVRASQPKKSSDDQMLG